MLVFVCKCFGHCACVLEVVMVVVCVSRCVCAWGDVFVFVDMLVTEHVC